MSSGNDDIEARIRRFRVRPGAEMRRRTLCDVLAAHERSQDAGSAAIRSAAAKTKTTSDGTVPVGEAALPVRKGKNIMKTLKWSVPVAAAACIVAGLLVWISARAANPGPRDETGARAPSGTEQVSGTGSELNVGPRSARWRSTQEVVAEADLVIRAKFLSGTETPEGVILQYNVVKVLKGKADSEVVKVRWGRKLGEPAGTEHVVFLRRSPGNDSLYLPLRVASDELDRCEAEILDFVTWTEKPAIDSRVEVNATIRRDGPNIVYTGTGDTVPLLATWCLEVGYFHLDSPAMKQAAAAPGEGDLPRLVVSLRFKTPKVTAVRIGLALYDGKGGVLAQATHLEPLYAKGNGKGEGVVRDFDWGDGRRIGFDLPKSSRRAARVKFSLSPVLATTVRQSGSGPHPQRRRGRR